MTLKRTRFDDGEQRLFYGQVDRSLWRYFHQYQQEEPRPVGPSFPSKETLLAALEDYGREFGFEPRELADEISELRDRLNNITADYEDLQRRYADLKQQLLSTTRRGSSVTLFPYSGGRGSQVAGETEPCK